MLKEIIQEIDHSIFREYDIRGIYNETLTDKYAYKIGRAFATVNNSQNNLITILRDGRHSSRSLADNLIRGLTDSGANVINLGVGPTPMLYFSNYNIDDVTAGIMITGSHNPPSHNGFKFIKGKKSFYGDDLQNLKNIILTDQYLDKKGDIINYDSDLLKNTYIRKLIEAYNKGKKLSVAWDPGNGASGEIVKDLCANLKDIDHVIINAEINGNFPNHHPDPTIPENLTQLIAAVKSNKCDLGIAFDGDGDRVGVVDCYGRILWGDQLLAIYASYILREHKGATIIADVKASNNLFNLITNFGGNAIMWKTGHSHIKAKMQQTNALLAGEMSGHMFFADKYYGYDDGIYAAVRLLDLLANSDLSLAELFDMIPKSFNTPEIRIDVADDYKFIAIEKLKEILKFQSKNYISIDGVRVNYPYGWWLIRASNTQAAIIARCEADDLNNLESITAEMKFYLKEINIDFNNF